MSVVITGRGTFLPSGLPALATANPSTWANAGSGSAASAVGTGSVVEAGINGQKAVADDARFSFAIGATSNPLFLWSVFDQWTTGHIMDGDSASTRRLISSSGWFFGGGSFLSAGLPALDATATLIGGLFDASEIVAINGETVVAGSTTPHAAPTTVYVASGQGGSASPSDLRLSAWGAWEVDRGGANSADTAAALIARLSQVLYPLFGNAVPGLDPVGSHSGMCLGIGLGVTGG